MSASSVTGNGTGSVTPSATQLLNRDLDTLNSEAMKYPTTAATAGQVLTNDGSGNLSWTTILTRSSLLTGLGAFYPFDGMLDTSGNNIKIPLPGLISMVMGIQGMALSSSQIPVTRGVLAQGDWTVSLWAMHTNLQYLFLSIYDAAIDHEVDITFQNWDSSNTFVTISPDATSITSSPLPKNDWHHVVVTATQAGALNAYVDNASIGTTTTNIRTAYAFNVHSNDATSAICQIGFWNRILTTAEISALYNDGVGFDPTKFIIH